MTKNVKQSLINRLFWYMVGGTLYFWSGYLVFFICDKGLGLNLWWSKLIANIVGMLVNFVVQRFKAFRVYNPKQQILKVSWRFVIITAVNFVIDYLIVKGLKVGLGISPYIGQFISAGFFTVWSYLWYKLWVFKPQPAGR